MIPSEALPAEDGSPKREPGLEQPSKVVIRKERNGPSATGGASNPKDLATERGNNGSTLLAAQKP